MFPISVFLQILLASGPVLTMQTRILTVLATLKTNVSPEVTFVSVFLITVGALEEGGLFVKKRS